MGRIGDWVRKIGDQSVFAVSRGGWTLRSVSMGVLDDHDLLMI